MSTWKKIGSDSNEFHSFRLDFVKQTTNRPETETVEGW